MASKVSNPNKTDNLGHITNNEVLRIVMVGKTGTGKSATGNTILGKQCFVSKASFKSLTTDCAKHTTEVDGQKVAVIDTPGLCDTRYDEKRTAKDLSQCITYASPGPHVFLVVIGVGRYTEEEKETVKKIQVMFGQEANKYSMVLFTHGDNLIDNAIEDFIDESSDIQDLVAKCNHQYHVVNNKLEDRSQVTELFQKIRNLVLKNGGSHYTNEMFQAAERAIQEEKQHIQRENEEKIQKEKEKLEREIQEKNEKEMRKITELMEAERERERKDREEERRREKQAMEEERERERKIRDEERKREREEREEERKRETEAREQEKREMVVKEEERKREREAREEERKREKEAREEERKSEREVREEERREREAREERKEREFIRIQEQRERLLIDQLHSLQARMAPRPPECTIS